MPTAYFKENEWNECERKEIYVHVFYEIFSNYGCKFAESIFYI